LVSWRVKTLRRAENFRKPGTGFGVSISTNGVHFITAFAKLSFVKL
jgi:hypothetical protein